MNVLTAQLAFIAPILDWTNLLDLVHLDITVHHDRQVARKSPAHLAHIVLARM